MLFLVFACLGFVQPFLFLLIVGGVLCTIFFGAHQLFNSKFVRNNSSLWKLGLLMAVLMTVYGVLVGLK